MIHKKLEVMGIVSISFTCLFLIFGVEAQVTTGTYTQLSAMILSATNKSDIICLGEKSHGDMNAHALKARILKDVVGQAPVGAVLFEAPLVASVMAHLKKKSYASFVWPFWKYDGLRQSLDSITGSPGMICLGFDPQETCEFLKFSSFLLEEGYLENDAELAEMDSLLAIAIYTRPDQETRQLTSQEAKAVARLVEVIRLNLIWPSGTSLIQKALIKLCLDNRIFLAKEMTFERYNDQINFRDSIMALNIQSINELFAVSNQDKKTVVWAANMHIARKWNSTETYMMERYIEDNQDRVLSIGVIPKKRKRESRRYDFAVINPPQYMSTDELLDYDCK